MKILKTFLGQPLGYFGCFRLVSFLIFLVSGYWPRNYHITLHPSLNSQLSSYCLLVELHQIFPRICFLSRQYFIKYSFTKSFIVPKYFCETSITAHTYRPLGNDAFKLSTIFRILAKHQTLLQLRKFQYEWSVSFSIMVLWCMGGQNARDFLCKIHLKLFCNNSCNPN